jgi:energy-converting hydrogenase Eha subunit C
MIILIHVLIALSSIGIATFTFFKPTTKRLGLSYGFIVATVASGTYLIVAASGDILKSCLTGLFYLTVVSLVTIATHVRVRRLAHQHIRHDTES